MANFIGFLAARAAKAAVGRARRRRGSAGREAAARCYASAETHTWVQKAADLFGLGTMRSAGLPTDDAQRMDVDALRRQMREDRAAGRSAVPRRRHGRHGAAPARWIRWRAIAARVPRGGPLVPRRRRRTAASRPVVPGAPEDLRGIALADSVAVDPHKWLYAPLEAGCALVRDRDRAARRLRVSPGLLPPSGRGERGDEVVNYYQYGPQNSRGFRALKVWLGLRHGGAAGLPPDDRGRHGAGARPLRRRRAPPGARGVHASGSRVTTFRYVPAELAADPARDEEYLDRLNTEILTRLQKGGEVYLSNAVVAGASCCARASSTSGRRPRTSPRSRRSWRGRAGRLTGT